MKKIRVGVIFGGRSAEHEISIRSAKSIINSLDKNKYTIIPIGVDRNGKFYLVENSSLSLNMPHASKILESCLCSCDPDIINVPYQMDETVANSIDVIFPVLHGPYGEDGCIQGLCKSFNIPFVGADVLGSAIAMDKDVTKRLLQEANIPCAKSITFRRHELNDINYKDVTKKLGNIIFVKPANLGSSVGINKVQTEKQFFSAIKTAFLYDNKILVEEFIPGREIECAVLGMENPAASVLGEIIVKADFYSYDAKYIDDDGADLKIPADLSDAISNKIREIAIKAFKVLCIEGMARVDFLLKNNNEIFLNEVNTIPGFTEEISMYPKLWEASGLPYSELLDKLIEIAIDRFERDRSLSVTQ